MSLKSNREAAIASFRLIETGDPELARKIIDDNFVNLEAADDPDEPDRELKGPDGFLATSFWLLGAFADLRFENLEVVAENDTVVAMAEMTGRHTGEFQGIPATGKPFRQRQIHVFRMRAGKVWEHRAQRDDLGLLLHLGWRPDGVAG
jgi:predicted ester cyclase